VDGHSLWFVGRTWEINYLLHSPISICGLSCGRQDLAQ
jgi:hypothetical protein